MLNTILSPKLTAILNTISTQYSTQNKIVILQEQMTASRSEDLIIKDLKNYIKIDVTSDIGKNLSFKQR